MLRVMSNMAKLPLLFLYKIVNEYWAEFFLMCLHKIGIC